MSTQQSAEAIVLEPQLPVDEHKMIDTEKNSSVDENLPGLQKAFSLDGSSFTNARNHGRSAKSVQEPEPEQASASPEGGYGWICVCCVFLINAHTWGVNSSYGIFLAYYLANGTFPGATSLEYAFVGGLSISLALLMSPVATFCTRKYGTQVTLAIGITFETAGLLGASWASEIWHLFLAQGVAFGFGMGFLFVASVGVVPQWFVKRRSFANSIATAGSGIGGLIYSLGTNAMIESVGLGWAFRILAIVAFTVNTICTILIRDRNKAIGAVQLAFDVRLFRRTEFLLMLGWGFFSMLAYVVLLFSLPNYARSIGLSAQQGSVVGAMLNLGQGLGRPFIGFFSDAFGRLNMAGSCTFVAGLFCLVIWIFARSYGFLIFFGLITGGVAGTFWATVGPVGAEVIGLQMLPSALSILWIVLVLPCTFSEPIGLELRRNTGNIYLHAQIFTGVMYIAAALCIWLLRAWRIRELQRMALGKLAAQEMVNDDAVARARISREAPKISNRSVFEAARGLWAWQRV